MGTVLVTGSAGLVGSACVRHFAAAGWLVHGFDCCCRRYYFGADGDNSRVLWDLEAIPNYEHYDCDICTEDSVKLSVERARPDLIIHAAAQPSHDYAADHPFEDFDTNARGTLNLLEACRRHAPGAVFVLLSTNKVYGDTPNRLPLVEQETRYDLSPEHPYHRHGIDEYMSVDTSMHSLFGCSKLAADLYCQEYGRYFGLRTVCFRAGCLTGGAHAGAEMHGFLAYLAKCCREGRRYRVYGHGGKQVRDQLHASDVARAIEAVYNDPPPAGSVYNLGGGRGNSCSVVEAIALMEEATERRLDVEFVEQARRGDHQWWISDCGKFQRRYPGWAVRVGLGEIVAELAGATSSGASSACTQACAPA